VIPKFITRDADGRVIAPDYTPSSPHRLSDDDAVNAWLWLIKSDGDVDDTVLKMMDKSGLFADKDSVVNMLAGVHRAGGKATATAFFLNMFASSESMLHHAVKMSNLDAIKCMCEGGVKLSAGVLGAGWSSYPLLFLASDLSVVKYLLSRGADASESHTYLGTPLHFAKSVDIARVLIEARANVTSTAEGQTPLHCAENADIAQFLLDNEADVNSSQRYGCSPLHKAKNVDVARVLIQARANVNVVGPRGSTPLHVASDIDTVKLLVESGALLNVQDVDRQTPLFLAVKANDLAKTQYLMEKKADVNVEAKIDYQQYFTPLMRAVVDNADISIVKCLLDNKADPNVLHLAASVEQCKLLIKHGANVTAQGSFGGMPLHVARDADIAKCLIEHGSVDPLDMSMQTPLHHNRNADVVQDLLANGADVNAKDKDGNTPLHLARDVAVAKLLVEAKADLEARSCRMQTPLVACLNKEVRQYLKSVGAKE
jgi:ankyrin repeat protein